MSDEPELGRILTREELSELMKEDALVAALVRARCKDVQEGRLSVWTKQTPGGLIVEMVEKFDSEAFAESLGYTREMAAKVHFCESALRVSAGKSPGRCKHEGCEYNKVGPSK